MFIIIITTTTTTSIIIIIVITIIIRSRFGLMPRIDSLLQLALCRVPLATRFFRCSVAPP